MAKYYRRIFLSKFKVHKVSVRAEPPHFFFNPANPFLFYLIVNAYNLLRNFPIIAVNLFTRGVFI